MSAAKIWLRVNTAKEKGSHFPGRTLGTQQATSRKAMEIAVKRQEMMALMGNPHSPLMRSGNDKMGIMSMVDVEGEGAGLMSR